MNVLFVCDAALNNDNSCPVMDESWKTLITYLCLARTLLLRVDVSSQAYRCLRLQAVLDYCRWCSGVYSVRSPVP